MMTNKRFSIEKSMLKTLCMLGIICMLAMVAYSSRDTSG